MEPRQGIKEKATTNKHSLPLLRVSQVNCLNNLFTPWLH